MAATICPVRSEGEVFSKQFVTLQSSVGVEEEDGVRRERGREGNRLGKQIGKKEKKKELYSTK